MKQFRSALPMRAPPPLEAPRVDVAPGSLWSVLGVWRRYTLVQTSYLRTLTRGARPVASEE